MDLGMALNGGTLRTLPATATPEEMIMLLNELVILTNDRLKTQVLSDGTTKRMIFGYQKDGWGAGQDFGMKISHPGVDVTKATGEQLLFNMNMKTWRFFDDDGRNYVNIGLRSTGTYGFEMAKPTEELDEPS